MTFRNVAWGQLVTHRFMETTAQTSPHQRSASLSLLNYENHRPKYRISNDESEYRKIYGYLKKSMDFALKYNPQQIKNMIKNIYKYYITNRSKEKERRKRRKTPRKKHCTYTISQRQEETFYQRLHKHKQQENAFKGS